MIGRIEGMHLIVHQLGGVETKVELTEDKVTELITVMWYGNQKKVIPMLMEKVDQAWSPLFTKKEKDEKLARVFENTGIRQYR